MTSIESTTMRMPRFTAEESLSNSDSTYTIQEGSFSTNSSTIMPMVWDHLCDALLRCVLEDQNPPETKSYCVGMYGRHRCMNEDR